MRWREGRQSENVEDRRGMSRGGMAIGGGLGGIVILVIALLLGADPRQFERTSNGLPTPCPTSAATRSAGKLTTNRLHTSTIAKIDPSTFIPDPPNARLPVGGSTPGRATKSATSSSKRRQILFITLLVRHVGSSAHGADSLTQERCRWRPAG